MKARLSLLYFCCLISALCPVSGFAQTGEDESIIYLKDAKRAEQYQKDGISYQRVIGPARFLHNNTLILCDTAIWDTKNRILDAKGHVQIIQEQTRLTGETVHYVEEINLAQVRGKLVELFDNKNNRLRTELLDFNTKDSIGIFYGGGSMVDSAGNVLESLTGHYYSKEKLFTFEHSVEMNTDTVKIKANFIHYETNTNIATFRGNVHAWHTDGYLHSDRGRYERNVEAFHFAQDVYVKTDQQEIWADTLNYDRRNGTGTLFGNIQILDTTQSVILLGDRGDFQSKPQKARLSRDPVFLIYNVEDGVSDTLFARADTLSYSLLQKYQVDSSEVAAAEMRLSYLNPKPSAISDSASTQASAQNTAQLPKPPSRQASPEALASDATRKVPPPSNSTQTIPPPPTDSLRISPLADSLHTSPPTDSLQMSFPTDSLQILSPTDSLQISPPADSSGMSLPQPDSLSNTLPPLDTTSVRFIYAYHHVKAYRSNGQGLCDSLAYNSLDSTARLYGQPVLWHEKNQFSADSIQFHLKNNQISRADLFSSAYIIAEEDSLLFNQIKGNDMVGYFRDNDIYKFDVIGAVEAIFCIREDSIVTSLNMKESKELTVSLKERQVQRIHYKETIKSTLYPLYELSSDKRQLANFNWRAAERPKDRFAITTRHIRPSAAEQFEQQPLPKFPFTERYFPGHIKSLEEKRAAADSTEAQNILSPGIQADSLSRQSVPVDSLMIPPVPDVVRDSLPAVVTPLADTTAAAAILQARDSLDRVAQPADSRDTEERVTTPTRKELRAQRKALRKEQAAKRKAERQLRKQQRKAARAAKAAARAEKGLK